MRHPELFNEIDIRPPPIIMLGQFILVERTARRGARRSDERVFDSGGPKKERRLVGRRSENCAFS